MSVSTEPVVTTVTVPDKSVALAPASVYVAPSSTVTGVEPDITTVGAVVSTTLTTLDAVPSFPEGSTEKYETLYVPTVSVSTVLVDVTSTDPDKSVAVAPASVYCAPSSTVAGSEPVTTIAGAVVSTTLTVLEAVPELPEASVEV